MLKTFASAALVALLLFAPGAVARDDDDEGRSRDAVLFEASLVRAAALNTPSGTPAGQQLGPAFLATGTDPLSSGQVRVYRNRNVEVRLRGAVPNAAYRALFCRLGFLQNNGCIDLGQVETNPEGNAEARLNFPAAGADAPDTWAGGFLLSRETAPPQQNQPAPAGNQYVSAFTFPLAAAETTGAEIELKGRVVSLDANAGLFRLDSLQTDILTTSGTKFEEIEGLADLSVGQDVEVKGSLRSDLKIIAERVKLEGDNGRKHHGDDDREDGRGNGKSGTDWQ